MTFRTSLFYADSDLDTDTSEWLMYALLRR